MPVPDDSGLSGPHPDLRKAVCSAINEVQTSAALPPSERLRDPVTPEELTFRCQHTWFGIRTVNPRLSGGDVSAAVVQFARENDLFAFFVVAFRPSGETGLSCGSMSGGRQPPELADRAGGFHLAGGSHVCVGGLGAVPDGGMIRVEMADGSVYSSTAVDGCCIVLAPVTTPPTPDDHVTVRFLRADGSERGVDTVRLGDGSPPPGVRPAPLS